MAMEVMEGTIEVVHLEVLDATEVADVAEDSNELWALHSS